MLDDCKLCNQYQDTYFFSVSTGTGKTVTGVHIAYWFAQRNKELRPEDIALDLEAPEPREAPPQVIYCGPSNKSVDVVTG